MEGDREVLCGPKGRHQVERTAWRGGSADSQVVLGGRQVEVLRLRMRSADGEVPLVSFEWAAATDPLDEHTLAAVAAKRLGAFLERPLGELDLRVVCIDGKVFREFILNEVQLDGRDHHEHRGHPPLAAETRVRTR